MRYAGDVMIAPRGFTGYPKINAAVAEVTRELSPWVRQIRYGVALDWSGEWAVFFRVLLSDEAAKQPKLRNAGAQVIEEMSEKLDLPNLGLFPYFDFRSESEQSELNDPDWAAMAKWLSLTICSCPTKCAQRHCILRDSIIGETTHSTPSTPPGEDWLA
jgi:hypothetical protein